ncbi:hypothetical protein [Williamsoniiplasma lucivorax]|uniref:hypothetical protein n=1 Tax=Williamsoniiplasma lucivorax TaxID=209274 RepID=UPI0011B0D229|nr:hypothetical protein [Williamsoniiplasma lucivorax]
MLKKHINQAEDLTIDLGPLNDNQKATIINAFIQQNRGKGVDIGDIEIINEPDTTSATIGVKTTLNTHKGSVQVNYQVRKTISTISGLDLDLGQLNDNQKATIIQEFIDQNPDKDLLASDLEIQTYPSGDSATIKVKTDSGTHKGEVIVTFTTE